MQLTKVLSALALIAAATATPFQGNKDGYYGGNKGYQGGDKDNHGDNSGYRKCLSSSVASSLVNGFGSLLTSFDKNVANNLLSSSFTDTSDSINYLVGAPLGGTTFASKDAFIAGQGSQPPIEFTVLAIDSVSCEGVITIRWVAGVGSKAFPIKGINVFYASLKGQNRDAVGPDGWQIDTVYSEFNSAAWIVDIGGTCPPVAPPTKL